MELQDLSCHVDNNNKLKFGSSKSTPPFSMTGQLDREYSHCSVKQCFTVRTIPHLLRENGERSQAGICSDIGIMLLLGETDYIALAPDCIFPIGL